MQISTQLSAAAAALLLGLAGCGVAYRDAANEFIRTQPPSAWGSQPPAGHQEIERSFIQSRLRDPDSARFQFSEPRRVTVAASMSDPTVVPVWESEVLVNGKNALGGYTGFKPWSFYYSNGALFAVESAESGRQYVKR